MQAGCRRLFCSSLPDGNDPAGAVGDAMEPPPRRQRQRPARFGGMKIERTWFAADKTGFHMLHTLFQTSLQFPQIQRFDEHFVLDLLGR